MPQIGDQALDFTLNDQKGEPVTLSDLMGQKIIVLFFYPRDYSAACTLEVCAFRDQYTVFQEAGAEVIGISNDGVMSHSAFAMLLRVPFTLLSDPGGKVRKLWEVPSTMGILQGRVTYVIDMQGCIHHIFDSQINPIGHVDEALKAIRALQEIK